MVDGTKLKKFLGEMLARVRGGDPGPCGGPSGPESVRVKKPQDSVPSAVIASVKFARQSQIPLTE